MPLHPFSAHRLSDELAAHRVTPREQAMYVAISFAVSLVLAYLFIVPQVQTSSSSFQTGLWAYEALGLLAINTAGVFYCLRRCWVAPERNFVIDFSCLYAPVSLVVYVVVWATFYLYVYGVLGWLVPLVFTEGAPEWMRLLYETKLFD